MIWRDGRPVTGQGDHILVSDRRDFYNARIREPRVSTDHQILLAEIGGYGTQKNQRYRKGRTTCPIAAPKRGTMQEKEAGSTDLRK